MQNIKLRDLARRIEAQEKELKRYELLENVLKYLREYGSDIKATVGFGASAVNFHSEAAHVVRELMFGDWNEDGRRRVQTAIENEMKQIEERLS